LTVQQGQKSQCFRRDRCSFRYSPLTVIVRSDRKRSCTQIPETSVSDSPSLEHLIDTELYESKISAILKRTVAIRDILCSSNQLTENTPNLTVQQTGTNVLEVKIRS
jgi:hypothetical protein